MKKVKNNILFLFYTILLGAIVGAIIWAFLKVMNLGIEFLWDYLPSQFSFPLFQNLSTSAVLLSTSLPRSITIGFAPLCARISAANNPAGPIPTTSGEVPPFHFGTS